jgi:hypothetical protein
MSVPAAVLDRPAGDEVAALVAALVGHDVDRVILFSVGAVTLDLVGQQGYDVEVATAWRRIPKTLEIPLTAAARSGAPIFLGSPEELVRRYPASAGTTTGSQAWAVVPVRDAGGQTVAVIGLAWTTSPHLDEEALTQVSALVDRHARLLLQHVHPLDDDDLLLAQVLRLIPESWLLLAQHGVDVVVDDAAPSWPGGSELVGHPLTADPALADESMLEEVRRLFLDPDATLVRAVRPDEAGSGRGVGAPVVRAGRVGSRILMLWTPAPGLH